MILGEAHHLTPHRCRTATLWRWVPAAIATVTSATAAAAEPYSGYAQRAEPVNVYWGDTHVHTNLSLDAYGMGNTALRPDDAYRLAQGEAVTAHNGMVVGLHRPLDFLVVADHAENLGVMPRLAAGDPELLRTDVGRRWHELMQKSPLETGEVLTAGTAGALGHAMDSVLTPGGTRSFFWPGFGQKTPAFPEPVGDIGDEAFRRSVWEQVGATADRHNEPNRFTAFVGFEWTSSGQRSGNLHRVVIFEDGPERTNRVLPYSAIDSQDPEDLWAYLAHYQQETGGDVLAIAHNGNTSNGEMFALQDFAGRPLSRAYAETRSRWEPLYEVTQIKGDSETHPILSPTDEFADYETWNSWAGWTYEGIRTQGWETRKASEYARSALKLGLEQQARLGVNPFKFGLIGSTDAHTSLSAVEESGFWGKASLLEPSSQRLTGLGRHIAISQDAAAAGYAAVWATENTRAALFAAMKRKETYATTGPRMVVRFFGGWNYQEEDAWKPDLAHIGYAKGVPMGADLAHAPGGKAPSFLIRAVKDPDGANLDRVQMIKGWRSVDGELHEKVYNVALSDGRREGKDHQAPPVGSTVIVADASYTNTIGDPELAAVWIDTDFDPAALAFYYLRVLEIPTPRWTAYDAKFFGLKELPKDLPLVTQERAYTSPIWYTP